MTANDIINDFERKELIEWAMEQFEIMRSCAYTWKKDGDEKRCADMIKFLTNDKWKCCANCKHSEQGECDGFENCSFCHAGDCYCRIKQKTRNSAGEYHDWDDKCDRWELKKVTE